MEHLNTYLTIGAVLLLIICLWVVLAIHNAGVPKHCHKKAARLLKKYAGIRNFKVLTDLDVEINGRKAHFDDVLVGFFGILFVTTLDETASYYGTEREERWTVVNKGAKSYFPNPVKQGLETVDVARTIFSKNGVYNIQMEHVALLTGWDKKTETFIPAGLPVYRKKELKQYLLKSKFEKDNDVDVERLCGLLEQYRTPLAK
ncbi:MAG: hypothetical protein PHD67_04625 [Oscillospiraceae bacterium]|nr:hypothetical protein [Oscillospiraceae bacterium]